MEVPGLFCIFAIEKSFGKIWFHTKHVVPLQQRNRRADLSREYVSTWARDMF